MAAADGRAERLLLRFRRRHGMQPKEGECGPQLRGRRVFAHPGRRPRLTPPVLTTAERVTSPGPAGDARRRMLR